jgi:predicted metal-dependent phosphoesterase TrpH
MNATYKLDLHTHSIASPDGSIGLAHYKKAFDDGLLDYVAITDHDRIDYALLMQQEFGDKIIVGEEIMTQKGEIIGLFLKQAIPPELTVAETVARIKEQDGLVYIPHPFETVRKGLHPAELEAIEDLVDIIEVCNGRAFTQNRSAQALVWARLNATAGAASSDAHGLRGLGKTHMLIKEKPTRKNLVDLCKTGVPVTDRPGLRALLYPKYNRWRKRFKKDIS